MLILLFLLYAASDFEHRLSLGQYYMDRSRFGQAVTEYETAVAIRPDSAEAHYSLGVALRAWGDSIGALRELRTALRLRPRFPEAHLVLGLVLGDAVGKQELGLAEFQAAVAQDDSLADAHFNIGVIRYKKDEIELAAQAFSKAVRLRPDSADFRFRLGQALARSGKLREAKAELERAIELNPSGHTALYELSKVYKQLGDASKARSAFAALVRLRKQTKTVERDEAGLAYRRGMDELSRGRPHAAIELLRRALTAPFDEARIRVALGIALQRNGDLEAADEEFRKALTLDPKSPDAHLNYGVLLAHRGDAASANREFRAALATDPNFAEAHFNIGLLAAAHRHWDEAADSLRTAIRISPAHARAHWNLGRVLRDSGDLAGAKAAYSKALQLDSGLTQAALEYGRLLPSDQAREIWYRTLQRDPLNHDVQTAYLSVADDPENTKKRLRLLRECGYPKAVAELNYGSLESAIQQLRAILLSHPDLSEVRRTLALGLFRNHQYSDAAEEYSRLANEDAFDSALRVELGAALREAGALDQAGSELQQALRLQAEPARVHFQLGLLYRQLHEEARAMEHFHEARRLDPSIQLP